MLGDRKSSQSSPRTSFLSSTIPLVLPQQPQSNHSIAAEKGHHTGLANIFHGKGHGSTSLVLRNLSESPTLRTT